MHLHHEGSTEGTDYLGVRLREEQRLILVPLDPARPWAAFRRMQAWMKRAPEEAATTADAPARDGRAQADQDAWIIPLRPLDREL